MDDQPTPSNSKPSNARVAQTSTSRSIISLYLLRIVVAAHWSGLVESGQVDKACL